MPGTYSADTNQTENGKAIVELTVAMQPGDNYRAAASCLQDAITEQVSQTDADLLGVTGGPGSFVANGGFDGYKVPVVWSEMLTVWRKLHVEADSMGAEPTTVAGREPDWQDVYISDVTVNADTSTLHLADSLSRHSPHQFEGGRVIAASGFTLAVIDHTDSTIEVNRALTPPEIAYVRDQDAVVKDDDPNSGLLPEFFTMTSFIKNAYADAYIDIVDLDNEHNPNTTVDFDLYITSDEIITGSGWNNSKDVDSTNDYWASFVVASYQAGGPFFLDPAGDQDNDPDPLVDNATYPSCPCWPDEYEETRKTGVTATFGDWESIVFRAAVLEYVQHSFLEDQVVAHEIGHSAGNTGNEAQHHNERGLMGEGVPTVEAVRFWGTTLKRFREADKW